MELWTSFSAKRALVPIFLYYNEKRGKFQAIYPLLEKVAQNFTKRGAVDKKWTSFRFSTARIFGGWGSKDGNGRKEKVFPQKYPQCGKKRAGYPQTVVKSAER